MGPMRPCHPLKPPINLLAEHSGTRAQNSGTLFANHRRQRRESGTYPVQQWRTPAASVRAVSTPKASPFSPAVRLCVCAQLEPKTFGRRTRITHGTKKTTTKTQRTEKQTRATRSSAHWHDTRELADVLLVLGPTRRTHGE